MGLRHTVILLNDPHRAGGLVANYTSLHVITSGRYDTEVINSARIFSWFFFHFVSSRARSPRACGGDDNFR